MAPELEAVLAHHLSEVDRGVSALGDVVLKARRALGRTPKQGTTLAPELDVLRAALARATRSLNAHRDSLAASLQEPS